MPHYLKHNIRSESPQQCVFFDTETNSYPSPPDNIRLELKFGMACYIRRIRHGAWSHGDWFTFKLPSEFWLWVESKTRQKNRLYVFAHNLAFDLTITKMFSELPKLGWKLAGAIIDDPPTIVDYRKEHRSIRFIDTFNYFRSSLSDLGDSVGLKKFAMPLENDSSDSWDSYCKRDVEIIKEAMVSYMDFLKSNDLGNFQFTIASQAFSAYRHRFMPIPVFIDSNLKSLELSRKAYYGGRTEAFFIGGKLGDFYLLDVNSMYPFVMRDNEYPVKLLFNTGRISINELVEYLDKYAVVADVTLTSNENVYPVRCGKRLTFPVGKFRTALTTPSLGYAIANGHILKVHGTSIYLRAPIFGSYVTELYQLRMKYQSEGNKAFSYLCKLMLNSLYGKFGQSGRVYEDVGATESEEIKSWVEYDADTKEVYRYRQFGGLIQCFKTAAEAFNSLPAVSAHVCDFARMYLYKLMRTAGLEHVYYVDTDSLVLDKQGYNILSQLFLGPSPGELKLVQHFAHLVINGAKDYVFDDVVKIKGIRKKAVKLAVNTYEQDKFSKFKTRVRSGSLDNMTVQKEIKVLKREYYKGIVEANGRVKAFNIESEKFDPEFETYCGKAAIELTNQVLAIGEGSKLTSWLESEVGIMEDELGKRTIPYGGGHWDGQAKIPSYFAGEETKRIDARCKVFSKYLSSHS